MNTIIYIKKRGKSDDGETPQLDEPGLNLAPGK